MSQLKLISIVEGLGEKAAVPRLLERLLLDKQRFDLNVWETLPAKGRDNIIKPNGLEGFLEVARREPADAVLVLLDADQDCAKELAESLAARTQALGLPFPVAIVCAKCEYEAWFLASLETIETVTESYYDGDVETQRDVKYWLKKHMPSGRIYKETSDQVAMTQQIDFTLARERSRSFCRLEHAIEQLLDSIDGQKTRITP